jgi:hypothetical protein
VSEETVPVAGTLGQFVFVMLLLVLCFVAIWLLCWHIAYLWHRSKPTYHKVVACEELGLMDWLVTLEDDTQYRGYIYWYEYPSGVRCECEMASYLERQREQHQQRKKNMAREAKLRAKKEAGGQ